MSQRYHVNDGIVIRRHALPSGDVIVTLFSEAGKWRGKAKQGKRLGGNLGKLSLFHDVTVQHYRRGDDDLSLITQVQLNGALPKLSDPAVYPYAHVLAELLDKLTVDVHVGEEMYTYFASGLRGLNQHADPEAVALVYAWRLLQQAGLSPSVTRCAVCGADPVGTTFDVASGGLTCAACNAGITLPDEVVDDLVTLLTGTVRGAFEAALVNRHLHWTLLQRYTAYHVGEVRSLGSLHRMGTEALRG